VNRTQNLLAVSVAFTAAIAASLLFPDPVSAALVLPTVRVPEPATAALVATGVVGVALEARRRRNKRDD